MENLDVIKKAINANRGGYKDATDQKIVMIWRSLPAETQAEYISKSKKAKGKSNAGITRQGSQDNNSPGDGPEKTS
jgi:hypothetical protein